MAIDNGRQHYEPIAFFGGEHTFLATLERDARKARLARSHQVRLIVATEDEPLDEAIERMAPLLR